MRVRDMMREAERDGWLEPKVVYGYFPVQSERQRADRLRPGLAGRNRKRGLGARGRQRAAAEAAIEVRELTRFVFPRQPERERLCLADYFRAVDDRASSTSRRSRW